MPTAPDITRRTLVAPALDQPGGTLTIGENAVTRLLASPVTLGSAGGPTLTVGTGSPQGVISAPVGSLFLRTDGGAATTLYVKESGTGATGWVGK